MIGEDFGLLVVSSLRNEASELIIPVYHGGIPLSKTSLLQLLRYQIILRRKAIRTNPGPDLDLIRSYISSLPRVNYYGLPRNT